ncbi:MAG: DcaP family trimeric outer membrane transporter [Myxococcota bacterium]
MRFFAKRGDTHFCTLIMASSVFILTVVSRPVRAQPTSEDDAAQASSDAQSSDTEDGADVPLGRYEIGRFPDNASVRTGDFDRSITIPGTGGSFRIGGFVRAALNFDVDNAGVLDNSLPWAVPLDGDDLDETTQLGFLLKDSQVNFDFRRPTKDYGLFRTFLEFDFFGSGSEVENSFGVRLRHAAVGLGGLQVGQFWTLFMDLKATPESADLVGPYGAPVLRTPGIRWYEELGEHWAYGLGVENPAEDLSGDTDQDVNDSVPNTVAFVEAKGSFGHLRVAGMGMRLDASDDESFAGAANLMGRIRAPLLHRKDNFTFGIQYGTGYGYHYAGFADLGLSGVIETDGEVNPTELLTGHVSFQKWWTDTLRSTVHVSYLDYDAADGAGDDSLSESLKVVGNIFWSPVKDAVFGFETVYLTRETFSGDEGEGLRLVLVTQFNF